MSFPLAVYTPQVGLASETFIRRHVQDLLPGKTVVLAGTARATEGHYWRAEGPLLELDAIERTIHRRIRRAIARRANLSPPAPPKSAERFLKQHGVEVIMGEYLHVTLPWLDVARKLGIRCFGHAHGADVSKLLRDPHWRRAYGRYNESGGVIAVTNVTRDRMMELGVDASRLFVIPCGVEVPAQPKERRAGEHVRCVAVGRMVTKKAPILLLDAFRRAALSIPNLVLDYIGDGVLMPAARQFVQAFGLSDRVRLHGAQPHAVVERMMDNADIFLQHSIVDPDTGDEEGLPVAVLEAMAQSLPVVSTRHAGIPEAVVDEETGFVVAEGDVAAMADRIVLLARDAGLRGGFGVAAWRRALDKYTWQRERDDLRTIMGLA